MKAIRSVSFIGSGNVATNLALSFFKKDIKILSIYSNTIQNAQILAQRVNAEATNDISQLNTNSDLIVVALKDDIIDTVLHKIYLSNSLLVHTSGSIDTNSLSQYANNFGCFYPFQTFRKEIETDLSEIYIFVETNKKESLKRLKDFALLFSSHVVEMNSEERKALHIAGVGLNNFTHYLLSITKQYCEDNNLKTDYLTHLLQQTVNNSFYVDGALKMQTGPARRGDVKIIKEHLDSLENSPKYKKIYKAISQLILDEFHEKNIQL